MRQTDNQDFFTQWKESFYTYERIRWIPIKKNQEQKAPQGVRREEAFMTSTTAFTIIEYLVLHHSHHPLKNHAIVSCTLNELNKELYSLRREKINMMTALENQRICNQVYVPSPVRASLCFRRQLIPWANNDGILSLSGSAYYIMRQFQTNNHNDISCWANVEAITCSSWRHI